MLSSIRIEPAAETVSKKDSINWLTSEARSVCTLAALANPFLEYTQISMNCIDFSISSSRVFARSGLNFHPDKTDCKNCRSLL